MEAPRRWPIHLAAALVLFLPTVAHTADPPLRWGGDKAGGAPFIYEEAGRGDVGFEVELARYLGQKLGRTPEFAASVITDRVPAREAASAFGMLLSPGTRAFKVLLTS